MTIVGLLVFIILIVLAAWVISQMAIPQPYQAILLGVILLIIVVAMMSVFGWLPHGKIVIH